MDMKKIFALIIAVLTVGIASAQPPMGGPGMGRGGEQGPKKSPVERIAGLVEELQLTAEQAEKFAPVYLSYQGEIRKIRKDLKTLMEGYNGKEIDEKLAFRMVMDQLNADADIIECRTDCHADRDTKTHIDRHIVRLIFVFAMILILVFVFHI